MSDDAIRDNLIAVFVEEGREGLQILDSTLHPADGGLPQAEAAYEHYRVGHKLKGAAALYQFGGISALGDMIERVLEHAKATPAIVWPKVVVLLRDLVNTLRRQLETVSQHGHEQPFDAEAWQNRYQSLLSDPGQAGVDASSDVLPELSPWTPDVVLPQIDAEVLEYFVPEIQELLATAEGHASELANHLDDPDRIHQLFRAIHTMKGSAYTVGYQVIGDVALPLEDRLRGLRDRREALPAPLLDMTSQTLAIVRRLIRRDPDEVGRLQQDIPALLATLKLATEGAPAEPPVSATPPTPAAAVAAPSPVSAPVAPAPNPVIVMDDGLAVSDSYLLPDLDPEVLSYFVPEAQEHLEALESFLLKLEKDPTNPELINQLFRSAHTLKGSAFTVGFTPIGDLVHHVEDLMGAIREGRAKFIAGMTDAILKSVDLVRLLMRRDPTILPQIRSRFRTVVADLQRLTDGVSVGVLPPTATSSSAPEAATTL